MEMAGVLTVRGQKDRRGGLAQLPVAEQGQHGGYIGIKLEPPEVLVCSFYPIFDPLLPHPCGMGKQMKLLSWNVNGLRAVLRKNFLTFSETEAPDILALQETKRAPSDVEPGLARLPGLLE